MERRQSDSELVREEVNLEGLKNDNEDIFAKLSSLKRRQSDSELVREEINLERLQNDNEDIFAK